MSAKFPIMDLRCFQPKAIWCAFWMLSFASAVSSSVCNVMTAVRGEALELSCSLGECSLSPPQWFNRTGEDSEEIFSGIDVTTGVLQVTASADSSVGGQVYTCKCGGESKCYEIHIPPKVDIEVHPQNVPVGGDVTITCSATEGYPRQTKIKLMLSSGIVTVQNGVPYTIRNASPEDGGMLHCMLSNIPTQPSKSAALNVYAKPHIVSIMNDTITLSHITEQPQDPSVTATLGCTLHNDRSNIVAKFFRNGVEVQVDGKKFTQTELIQKGSTIFSIYLIVDGVTEADLGVYEFCVFSNYSQLLLEDTRWMFIHSQRPGTEEVSPTSTSTFDYETAFIGMVGALSLLTILAVLGWVLACAFYAKLRRGRGGKVVEEINLDDRRHRRSSWRSSSHRHSSANRDGELDLLSEPENATPDEVFES